MKSAIEKDLRAYVRMLPELLDKAEGKFVLIHDGQRVGEVFDDYDTALEHGYRTFRLAPIFVHRIERLSEAATLGRVAECRI